MLTVLFMIQCDICGEIYEQIRTSCRPEPQEWSLIAGVLQATCTTEDFWFFNSKTRKHWCLDCKTEYDDCAEPPKPVREGADDAEAYDCPF
jgi:hypothetical protein